MLHKFTLEPVLNYRHQRVETLEIELGSLMNTEQRYQSLLASLMDMEKDLCEKMANSQDGEIDLPKLGYLRANLKTVTEQISNCRLCLVTLAMEIKEKRSEFTVARQEEEALVILKDKEYERFKAELNQQELRLQDDIYIAKAYRRSSGLG
jgi:flagellar export protein FliJ